MPIRTLIPWKPHPESDSAELERFQAAARRWLGTPYVAGQCAIGAGVDCLRFVAALACETEGREMVETDQLPQDTAFHRPDKARQAIRALMENFPTWQRVKVPNCLYPGDLVVVGPHGIPAHGMMVNTQPNTLIHAGRREVCLAPASFSGDFGFNSLYRRTFDAA